MVSSTVRKFAKLLLLLGDWYFFLLDRLKKSIRSCSVGPRCRFSRNVTKRDDIQCRSLTLRRPGVELWAIRTRKPSKLVPPDPRLRPRVRRDRLSHTATALPITASSHLQLDPNKLLTHSHTKTVCPLWIHFTGFSTSELQPTHVAISNTVSRTQAMTVRKTQSYHYNNDMEIISLSFVKNSPLLQHCQTNGTELIYILFWRVCATAVCTVANNSCSSHILTPAMFRVFTECDWKHLHVFYLGLESHDVWTKETITKNWNHSKKRKTGNFRMFSCSNKVFVYKSLLALLLHQEQSPMESETCMPIINNRVQPLCNRYDMLIALAW